MFGTLTFDKRGGGRYNLVGPCLDGSKLKDKSKGALTDTRTWLFPPFNGSFEI